MKRLWKTVQSRRFPSDESRRRRRTLHYHIGPNGLVVGAISVADKDSVVLMSERGQTLRMSMKDVRVMGRSTQGVRLVNLEAGDKVASVQKIEQIAEG